MESFSGKRIIITGGSKGIGLDMARVFARQGARLALLARGEEALAEARAALSAEGAEAHTFACDVTDAEALGAAIADACGALGGLDGIVANSGFCHPGYFHHIAPGDARRQIETNLTGTVFTLHHAIPHLLRNGGGFIAITSSPAGSAGVFGFSIYGATKAALNNLAHTLRAEYREQNIRVHLLLPPDTDTPGYAHEVTLYPPETRAVLSGGKLFSSEAVALRMVEGIRAKRRRVTVGFETRLLLYIIRFMPCVWELYTRRAVRNARKPVDGAVTPKSK